MGPGTTIAAMADQSDLTGLLRAWNAGSAGALDRLTTLVHDELRRLAHRYMRQEGGGHTLQTTALVNEAYIRLSDVRGIEWRDR
jgi:RNA polymerase sigma-70 factor (ECF subfamily)